MSADLQTLIDEIIEVGKLKGLSQKDIGELTIGETALSRIKKAEDARYSTLALLGQAMGKKLIWVDGESDLATLVSKGELF